MDANEKVAAENEKHRRVEEARAGVRAAAATLQAASRAYDVATVALYDAQGEIGWWAEHLRAKVEGREDDARRIYVNAVAADIVAGNKRLIGNEESRREAAQLPFTCSCGAVTEPAAAWSNGGLLLVNEGHAKLHHPSGCKPEADDEVPTATIVPFIDALSRSYIAGIRSAGVNGIAPASEGA